MTTTCNPATTSTTTAPAPLEESLWGPDGPPTPSAYDSPESPPTPRVYCAPGEPIPLLTFSEGDFPGHPAATADMRTTIQQKCDELSLEGQARRERALEEQALEDDAINEFERRRQQHNALADEAAAQLQAEEDDDTFVPEFYNDEREDMAGAPHQEQTSMDVDAGLTRASSGDSSEGDEPLHMRLTRVQEKRKREEEERRLEEERLREEAKVKLQEFYDSNPGWKDYRKPGLSDVGGDEAALQPLLDDWRTALVWWKQAGDRGYQEYRENRRLLLEVEKWTRADGYGKPRLPHGLKKGENAEEDAKLEVARTRRERLVTLWKLTGDRGYQRYKQHEDEVAAAGAQRRREKAKRAREEANPGSSPAAPRRSAPKAPHTPIPTDFAGVGGILAGWRKKLAESVKKELADVGTKPQHAIDLREYLIKANRCYDVAMEDARSREGSGATIPNIPVLRAYDCWDRIVGTEKMEKELNAQVEAGLTSVRDSPSAGHQLALGTTLEQLGPKAFVCPDDHAMLKLKITEMHDMIARVLGNKKFLDEAASDDPESNESRVLAELQSKGLLKASPHDLANWMLSLNTQKREGALKILAGGWNSSTQLAMLVRAATDPRIPEVEGEFRLLRKALSIQPQKVHTETLAEKLTVCKSLQAALAALKRDKSATTEAVKDAQQAFESARKELAKFGTLLKASFLAAGGNWRPDLRHKKELAFELNEVKEWANEQRESEEAKLKGPLTTVDKTFAEKRISQMGPHFAEQQFDFARGLYGSILEYFNAQGYMYLLVLSALAPEFCSTLRFKPFFLKEEFGRYEGTNHEVASWLLEDCTEFLALERPTQEAEAKFKHHQKGGPSSDDTGAGADAEEGESEQGGDMEVDSEAAGAGLEADEDIELAETPPLEDPEEGGQEATQALEVTGPLEADEATQLEETQPLGDMVVEVAGQLEANEATQLEETQPLGDMVVDGHTEGVEIALSEEDAVVEPPKKRRKPRREPSRDEEGGALQPRASGRARRPSRKANEGA